MSQQPSQPPYPPYLPYQSAGPSDLLAPSKRASTLMWVLGGVGILLGLCSGLLSSQITPEMVNQMPQRDQIHEIEAQLGISINSLYFYFAMVLIGVGGVLGILAFFVRRRSAAGSIVSAIFVGLVGLLIFLQVIGGVVGIATGGGAAAGLGTCMFLVPLALCVLLATWLVQAARNAFLIQKNGGMIPSTGPIMTPVYPPQTYQAPPPPQSPTQGAFGPAPFGIPPPPGEGQGKYGYATKAPEKPSDGGTGAS